MKGMVYISLNELVERQYGIQMWENILTAVQPPSEGIYTSTENYSDTELVALINEISRQTGMAVPELIRYFGEILFGELNQKYPIFSSLSPSLFDYLASIEGVIHQEVRKLYESVSLPSINTHMNDDKTLTLNYHSPRKLCYLAEGLIYGAAKQYNVHVTIDHQRCMHRDDDSCSLVVSYVQS